MHTALILQTTPFAKSSLQPPIRTVNLGFIHPSDKDITMRIIFQPTDAFHIKRPFRYLSSPGFYPTCDRALKK